MIYGKLEENVFGNNSAGGYFWCCRATCCNIEIVI